MKTEISSRKVVIKEEPIGWVYRKDIPDALKVTRSSYQRWLRKVFKSDPDLKSSYNRKGDKSKYVHVDDFCKIAKIFTECENIVVVFTTS